MADIGNLALQMSANPGDLFGDLDDAKRHLRDVDRAANKDMRARGLDQIGAKARQASEALGRIGGRGAAGLIGNIGGLTNLLPSLGVGGAGVLGGLAGAGALTAIRELVAGAAALVRTLSQVEELRPVFDFFRRVGEDLRAQFAPFLDGVRLALQEMAPLLESVRVTIRNAVTDFVRSLTGLEDVQQGLRTIGAVVGTALVTAVHTLGRAISETLRGLSLLVDAAAEIPVLGAQFQQFQQVLAGLPAIAAGPAAASGVDALRTEFEQALARLDEEIQLGGLEGAARLQVQFQSLGEAAQRELRVRQRILDTRRREVEAVAEQARLAEQITSQLLAERPEPARLGANIEAGSAEAISTVNRFVAETERGRESTEARVARALENAQRQDAERNRLLAEVRRAIERQAAGVAPANL